MAVSIPNKGFFSSSEVPLMGHPDTLTELLQLALSEVIEKKYNGLRHDLKLAIGGDIHNNIAIAVFGNVHYLPEWYNGDTLNQNKANKFYRDLRDALKQELRKQGNLSHQDADLEHLATKFFIRPQSDDLHGVQARAKKAAFGDQTHAIGYATAETREDMPVEFVLARKLAWDLEKAVADGIIKGGHDGKVIVVVEKDDSNFYGVRQVIVAKQHDASQSLAQIVKLVKTKIIPKSLGRYNRNDIEIQVNNGKAFNHGGVLTDMGVPCDYLFYTGYWTGADAPTGEDRTKADGPLQFYSRAIAKTLLEVLKPYGCRTVKVDTSTSMGSEEIKSLSVEIRDGNNSLMYTPSVKKKILKAVIEVFPTTAEEIMSNYWCNPTDLSELIKRGAVFGYTRNQLISIFGNEGYKRITWENVDDKINLLKPKIEKYLKNK